MIQSALSSCLFNPVARVYNLRLLLLVTIGTVVYSGLTVSSDPSDTASPVQWEAALSCGLIIWLHHSLCCFKSRVCGLAVIDMLLVTMEAGGTVYILKSASTIFFWDHSFVPSPDDIVLFLSFSGAQLVGLLVSMVFRFATMRKSSESIVNQRFDFFGCCSPAYPPYTSLSILINRSLSRPLVRGESRLIIIARAIILSCIAASLPAFFIYSIAIKPANSSIYTKSVVYVGSPLAGLDSSQGNAALFIEGFDKDFSFNCNVSVTLLDESLSPVSCQTFLISSGPNTGTVVDCGSSIPNVVPVIIPTIGPYQWIDIRSISLSILIPPGMDGVFVYLWKGNTRPDYSSLRSGTFGQGISSDSYGYTWARGERLVVHTALLRGSRVFGLLSWTKRRLIGKPTDVYTPVITALQPLPSTEMAGTNMSLLTLRQVGLDPSLSVRYSVDTRDDSVLSGIASFGGVWTFVNGAFALFFGANVIYFLFGRRPLSALGVVHVFQRAALVRQWNDDFPVIHTEGGLPGSERAGIVAFIRERLVDLGEDPCAPRATATT
ncbi:Short-chain dehydrogenase/reductase family protein [Mycena venus]|uniref:Short-chain dehydrogenase/reductase family protein n=1 Tax=Mycena venus TaxID=2733690 RepID=A0A8H7D1P0_9AGAR|nr:Short-chain dehydrogenase/reductase family protein [Mycena venus]